MCGWDEQIQWQGVQIYGEIKLHGPSIAVVLRAKVGQEICHKGKLEFSPSFDNGEQIFAFSQPSARGLGLIQVDPQAHGAKTCNFCTRVWRPNIWVWFPLVYSYMLDQSCAFHKLPVQFSRVLGNVSPRGCLQSALCFGLIVPVFWYTLADPYVRKSKRPSVLTWALAEAAAHSWISASSRSGTVHSGKHKCTTGICAGAAGPAQV